MRKLFFVGAAAFFVFPLSVFADEFKDKGGIVAVDFPSGWASVKTSNPDVSLKMAKGGAVFELVLQDSELSDQYLKDSVKERIDSLRSRGSILSGEIKSVSLHGVSNAYYTFYESIDFRGVDTYIAFFTYDGVSYAVSARGVGEEEFRGVLASVRKPGETIEQPKPKKGKAVPGKQKKAGSAADEADEFFVVARATETVAAVSGDSAPAKTAVPEVLLESAGGEKAGAIKSTKAEAVMPPKTEAVKPPKAESVKAAKIRKLKPVRRKKKTGTPEELPAKVLEEVEAAAPLDAAAASTEPVFVPLSAESGAAISIPGVSGSTKSAAVPVFDAGGAISTAAVSGYAEPILDSFPESASAVESSTQAAVPEISAVQGFIDELYKRTEYSGLPPYLPRKPLPYIFWVALAGLWFFGSFAAKSLASRYREPEPPAYPAEVQPDFHFPYAVMRTAARKKVAYSILTRQGQTLRAFFPVGHEALIAGSFYGCLLFHALWSILSFFVGDWLVVNVLLGLPLGRVLASLPEILFIAPLIAGLYMSSSEDLVLQLFDAQARPAMEVRSEESSYGLVRDGVGREVGRLVRKGSVTERRWDFVDTDNMVVFSIHDDFPMGYLLCKLFGSLGGALRSRYGIFAQDRRAGIVSLDPDSPDSMRIHLDVNFAGLVNPMQMLAAVLYVISTEKDPKYPSPF